VHALRNVHAALTPGGFVVDTQPLSPHPRVAADSAELGTLDMREWADTIRAVDERINEAVGAGLFDMQHEERFVVTDAFDTGAQCLETISNWRDTRIPRSLVSRLDATHVMVTVEQVVRLRVLRRATRSAS